MARIKFAPSTNDDFRKLVVARVNAYFSENARSRHLDWRMMVKLVFYLGGYVTAYAALLLFGHTVPAYMVLSVVLGGFFFGIGLNISHDAAHGAFSRYRGVNRVLAHTFTLIGVHVYTWKQLHNVLHHTHTNIPHADGDLDSVPVLRFFDDGTPPRSCHRVQHIYAFALYCLASLVWVFRKDFVHMKKREHCGYVKPAPPRSEWVLLYAGKFGHYAAFLLAPWLVTGVGIATVLLGFLAMHVVAGLLLASFFAVGHLVDGVEVVRANDDGRVEDSWMAHQLRTTSNFGINSSLLFWTAGGLNYQIEHHLFPQICHVHYPALAPIVRRTALECGLPYQAYPSLREALAAHVRFLRAKGSPATG